MLRQRRQRRRSCFGLHEAVNQVLEPLLLAGAVLGGQVLRQRQIGDFRKAGAFAMDYLAKRFRASSPRLRSPAGATARGRSNVPAPKTSQPGQQNVCHMQTANRKCSSMVLPSTPWFLS
jgi:hypothetical protein